MWLTISLLACGGAADPAPPTDPVDAPAPTEQPARAPDSDCRAGVLGVLAGLPGLPPGAGRGAPHAGPIALHDAPGGSKAGEWRADGAFLDGAETPLCSGGWGEGSCAGLAFAPEGIGLPVYAVRGSSVQIGVGPGTSVFDPAADCSRRLWVELERPLEVLRVGDLIRGNLVYLLGDWERTYAQDAGGPLEPFPGQSLYLDAKGSTVEGGETWIQADALSGLPCHGEATVMESDRWFRTHDDQGRLQIWYFTDC